MVLILPTSIYRCALLSLVWCCLGLFGCKPEATLPRLQAGDLLFQDLDCGALCEAIEAVTESAVAGQDFSHCGMVIEVQGKLMVEEAIGEEVQLTSLEDFFRRSGDSLTIKNIVLGRVKAAYRPLLPAAAQFARQQVGQPYDEVYLLNNGKWYCSELLYESFKLANNGQDFFKLSPMTFKDPTRGHFFPAWVSYYHDLGQDIPEGALGLNPGSISQSNKIDIIRKYVR